MQIGNVTGAAGKMLILIPVLIITAAAVAYFLTRNARTVQPNDERRFDSSNLRPLFQPTDEEIRAFEIAEENRREAEVNRREKLELEQLLHEKEDAFRAYPTNPNAAELLRVAAQGSDADTFCRAAGIVTRLWREDQTSLTAQDLAELLDSHFRLLPQQERTSGAIFELRNEIEELRRDVRGQ